MSAPARATETSAIEVGMPPLGTITPAENRVLKLLSRGNSNRRIAEQLVISPRTVESHVSSLLAKTGCRNRTQLTLWNQGQPKADG
jgi:DNA-binding NarL/FixJ family response regulator